MTIKTKHTPGPWTTVEHSWSRIGIYAGEKAIAALDIHEQATEETEDALGQEMAANALVMAAAPELAEALSILVENVTHAMPSSAQLAPVINARAALAKAGVL